MFLLAALLMILTMVYSVTLFILKRGLYKLQAGGNSEQPTVTVVVAARNEEANIAVCLEALLRQNYPPEKTEIIVVDDRSEDRTVEIVMRFSQKNPRVRLLRIQNRAAQMAPKKRAIDLGIRHAEGELIFTTDADCQPGPDWLAETVRHFEPEVGLVAGFCPYQTEGRPTFFQRILILDYFAMACVAAASVGIGHPLTCCGGNLAYRRRVYRELGGFRSLGRWVSGDDDFFLEKLRDHSSWQIRYAIDPSTFVATAPPKSFAAFCQQRIRYASKGRHYAIHVTLALGGVYLMNLLLTLGWLTLFKPVLTPFWIAGLLLKGTSEYAFLRHGQRVFQQKFALPEFLFTALVHPLYITLAGAAGLFLRFEWKGETYSRTLKPEIGLENR